MAGAVNTVGNIFHDVGNAVSSLFHTPKAPTLAAPNALSATPTQAQASTTAAQQNLASETTAASTATVLTGGQGLLDEPTTTSKTLLGS
jgi:hypothetical protein